MKLMKDKVQTMKLTSRVLILTFLMLMIGRFSWAQAGADDAPHALPMSIVTLLAQPPSKSVKRVQVSGFLVLEFEGDALYLHKEDYEQGLTRNAIPIYLSPEQQKQYKDLTGTYVTVEGSFGKRQNSEDAFTGSLFNIRLIRKTLSRH
jgi:hypothetical protein